MSTPAVVLALDIMAAKVARLRDLVATWEADEEEHLNTYGQHLMGGAVAVCAEQVAAILDDDSNPYGGGAA